MLGIFDNNNHDDKEVTSKTKKDGNEKASSRHCVTKKLK